MKKTSVIILLMIMFFFSLTFTSSLDVISPDLENQKYYYEEFGDYGKIVVTDIFDIKLAEYILYTSEASVLDAEANGETILYQRGRILDDVIFENLIGQSELLDSEVIVERVIEETEQRPLYDWACGYYENIDGTELSTFISEYDIDEQIYNFNKNFDKSAYEKLYLTGTVDLSCSAGIFRDNITNEEYIVECPILETATIQEGNLEYSASCSQEVESVCHEEVLTERLCENIDGVDYCGDYEVTEEVTENFEGEEFTFNNKVMIEVCENVPIYEKEIITTTTCSEEIIMQNICHEEMQINNDTGLEEPVDVCADEPVFGNVIISVQATNLVCHEEMQINNDTGLEEPVDVCIDELVFGEVCSDVINQSTGTPEEVCVLEPTYEDITVSQELTEEVCVDTQHEAIKESCWEEVFTNHQIEYPWQYSSSIYNDIRDGKKCFNIQNGEHEFTYGTTEIVEYNFENYDAGHYKWTIKAERSFVNQVLDWIIEAKQLMFTEWAWWNNLWGWKEVATVSNPTSEDLYNVWVEIEVSRDANNNVDFSDSRFTDNSESPSELIYTLPEISSNGNTATFKVNIPFIEAGQEYEIVHYYASPTATTSTGIEYTLNPALETGADVYDTLVSYYKFDDTTGATLDTHGTNDISYTAGATRGATGYFGNAYDFLEGEVTYLDMGYNPLDDDFTFNIWLNPDNTGGGFMGTTYSPSTSKDGWEFTCGELGSCSLRSYKANGENCVVNFADADTTGWHMVTATFTDFGYIDLYLDGVWKSQSASVCADLTHDSNMFIGADFMIDQQDGHEFDGLIDELSIFSSVLTEDEISSIYEKTYEQFGIGNRREDYVGYKKIFVSDTFPEIDLTQGLISSYDLHEDANDSYGLYEGTNNGAVFNGDDTTFTASDYISLSRDISVDYFSTSFQLSYGHDSADRDKLAIYSNGWKVSSANFKETEEWTHSAVVFNGDGTGTFYKNGASFGAFSGGDVGVYASVSVWNKPDTASCDQYLLSTTATELRVGDRSGDCVGTGHGTFTGDIKNLNIYRIALSDKEILDIFNHGNPVDFINMSDYNPSYDLLYKSEIALENQTFDDASGNGHTSTNYGSTWVLDTDLGYNIYDFQAGTDRIDLDFTPASTSATSFWIKPDGVNGGIMGTGSTTDGGKDGWSFAWTTNEQVSLDFWQGNNVIETVDASTSHGSVPANVWTHVVMSLEETTVKTYVNGVLDTTGTLSVPQTVHDRVLMLGRNFLSGGGASSFDGSLTQPIIYDRGVTEEEALLLYNEGVPINYSQMDDVLETVDRSWTVTNTLRDSLEFELQDATYTDSSDLANSVTNVGTTTVLDDDLNVSVYDIGTGDRVGIGSTFGNTLDAVYSSSFWFKPVSTGLMMSGQGGSSSPSATAYFFWSYDSNGKVTYYNHASGNGGATSDDIVTVNEWHHMVMVDDGSSASIYVDGVLQQDTAGSYYPTSPDYWALGSLRTQTGTFTGRMIGVRLYDDALTQSEVTQLYDAGATFDSNSMLTYDLDTSNYEAEVIVPRYRYNGKIDLRDNLEFEMGNGSLFEDTSDNEKSITTFGASIISDTEFGDVYDFDGVDDYLRVNNHQDTKDYSVSTWIKTDMAIQGSIFQSSGSSEYAFGVRVNAGKIRYIMFDGVSVYEKNSINLINDGTWKHLVITYSDTAREGKIFIDGVYDSTLSYAGGDYISENNIMYIGSYATTSLYLDGSLNQPRYYSKALTQSEITAMYNSGNQINSKIILDDYIYLNDDYSDLNFWANTTHPDLISYYGFNVNDDSLSFDGDDDYIDTGVVWDSTTIITLDGSIHPTLNTGASKIFGGTAGGYHWIGAGGINAFYAGTGGATYSTFTTPNNGQRVIMKYDTPANEVSINDEVKTVSPTITGGEDILIGTQSPNTDPTRFIIATVYSIQIEQGGEVVRDLRPTQNDCFFDLINSVEYCNDGIGNLSYQPSIYEVTSVEDLAGDYDATLNGDTIIIEDGKFENSVSLDGVGDYIETGFDGTELDEITLSLWINPSNITDTTYILDNSPASTGYALRKNGDELFVFAYSGGVTGQLTTSTANLISGEWAYLTFVHSETFNKIYKNGVLLDTAYYDASSGIDDSASDLIIGAEYDLSDEFNGSIDDVMIFDKALSDVEVLEIYDSYNGGEAFLRQDVKLNHYVGDVSGQGIEYSELSDSIKNKAVAVYEFDGNLNDSVNDFEATEYFGNIGEGKIGTGFEFDGVDDYVELQPTNELLPDKNSWSIVAWANPKALTYVTTSDNRVITLYRTDTQSSSVLIHIDNDDKWAFAITNSSSDFSFKAMGDAILNEWSQIILTYDGTTFRGYLNGEHVVSEINTLYGFGGKEVQLGKYVDDTRYFNGSIDEVMIFDEVLTDIEVAELYNERARVMVDSGDLNSFDMFYGNTNAMDEGNNFNNLELSLGDNFVDESYNQYSVTNNGVEKIIDGEMGEVYNLNGVNSKIDTNLAPNIDPSTTPYTISTWVNPTNIGSLHPVWGTDVGTNQRLYLADDTTEKWVLIMGDGAVGNKLFSVDDIDYTGFTNVIVVFDGSGSVEMFVNGESQGTQTVPSYTTTGDLYIGTAGATGSVYFEGQIYKTKVYSRVLTENEIMLEYNQYKKTSEITEPVFSPLTFLLGTAEQIVTVEAFAVTEDNLLPSEKPFTLTCQGVSANGVDKLRLFIDGSQYSEELVSGTNPTFDFQVNSVTDGEHTWMCEAEDGNGIKQSSIKNFNLDSVAPSVVIDDTVYDEEDNLLPVQVVVQSTISDVNLLDCEYRHSELAPEDANISFTCVDDVLYNFNSFGDHTITLFATDSYGHVSSSTTETITIEDIIPPTVMVNSPRGTNDLNALPIILDVLTNEDAVCYYSLNSGTFFAMNNTEGFTHQATISPSMRDITLQFKCIDTSGNIALSEITENEINIMSTSGGGASSGVSNDAPRVLTTTVVNTDTPLVAGFNLVNVETYDQYNDLITVEDLSITIVGVENYTIGEKYSYEVGKYIVEVFLPEVADETLTLNIVAGEGDTTLSSGDEIGFLSSSPITGFASLGKKFTDHFTRTKNQLIWVGVILILVGLGVWYSRKRVGGGSSDETQSRE